jgi:hypothetical protein
MAQYIIEDLGSPTAQTLLGYKAFGLNNLGTAVGVAHIPEARAVVWNPSPVKLPLLGLNSVAFAVNDSGHIVGAWSNNALQEGDEIDPVSGSAGQAFLYRNGQMQDLASVFGAPVSVAIDINNDGFIAGWAGELGSPHAFLYNSSQAGSVPKDLGFLPGHDASQAMAVNKYGFAVGISKKKAAPDDPHGFFFWGELLDLGPKTYAYGINDWPMIVGARLGSTGNWTAYTGIPPGDPWQSPAVIRDLGHLQKPGFVGSVARGINNRGDIVGHSFTSAAGGLNSLPSLSHAFLCPGPAPGDFVPGAMVDLNDLIPPNSGWVLHWALAINEARQIVGVGTYYGQYGEYLNPQYSAYLLTPLGKVHDLAIDPLALILGYDLYVKINLPRPPPVLTDALMDRVRQEIQAMGPEQKEHALARVRALGGFVRAVEEEFNKVEAGIERKFTTE